MVADRCEATAENQALCNDFGLELCLLLPLLLPPLLERCKEICQKASNNYHSFLCVFIFCNCWGFGASLGPSGAAANRGSKKSPLPKKCQIILNSFSDVFRLKWHLKSHRLSVDFFKACLPDFVRCWWPNASQTDAKGTTLEHICETRGIVKIMPPCRREHYFEDPRACGMVSDGRLWWFLFRRGILESLFAWFFRIWSSMGVRMGVRWDHFGTLFGSVFRDRFFIDFWFDFGQGRRHGQASAKSQNLQNLGWPQSRGYPCRCAANKLRLGPCRRPPLWLLIRWLLIWMICWTG